MKNREILARMSNKNLALFLSYNANALDHCADCVFLNFCKNCEQSKNSCEKMILKWLESEVEE